MTTYNLYTRSYSIKDDTWSDWKLFATYDTEAAANEALENWRSEGLLTVEFCVKEEYREH